MKTTKLNKLIHTYEKLGKELRELNLTELEAVLKSWEMSLSQINSEVNNPESSIKPSQFVSGLEQGLIETPLNLADLADEKRRSALRVFYRVVESNIPDFFEKTYLRLAEIISLGKIKTENDWYVVRNRIDEIEGLDKSENELSSLYNLINDYENA